MPWTKFHREQQLQGAARSWPRATRFIYQELCDKAREQGRMRGSDAYLELTEGGTLAQAVHDLIGGSVQEIVVALVKPGHLVTCDPPWLEEIHPKGGVETPPKTPRELRIVGFRDWQKHDDSRARVARHRQQKRELGNPGGPGVTRYTDVTGTERNGAVTLLEGEGEEDLSEGSYGPGVTRYTEEHGTAPEGAEDAPGSDEPPSEQGEDGAPDSGPRKGKGFRLVAPSATRSSPGFREAWRVFLEERQRVYPGVYQRTAPDGPAMAAIAKAAAQNAAAFAAQVDRTAEIDALVTFWLERFFERYLRLAGRDNELRQLGHPVRCAQREINACAYPNAWRRELAGLRAPERAAAREPGPSVASTQELALALRALRPAAGGASG